MKHTLRVIKIALWSCGLVRWLGAHHGALGIVSVFLLALIKKNPVERVQREKARRKWITRRITVSAGEGLRKKCSSRKKAEKETCERGKKGASPEKVAQSELLSKRRGQ